MKKPLILAVDDVDKNLQLIGTMLQSINVDISFATSAKKALSLLETITPDLIILDIVMPEMNGFELCERIWDLEHCSDMPVIFLSARSSLDDVVHGFKLGARDYLTKPIIKEELVARVRAQLSIKYSSDRLKDIVRDRTEALECTNKKLSEYNTALKVLLEKREQDRAELESNILANVENLMIPTLKRLKNSNLDANQQKLCEILYSHVETIVSPFSKKFKTALSYYGLTRSEFEISMLIRQGLSTAEIADIVNSSESTIAFHRNNIRQKLNIKGERVNLESFLNKLGNGTDSSFCL
jgi:DNA-binding response OmpR family regulator/DNA-binding CsgD family transcriptional regulator